MASIPTAYWGLKHNFGLRISDYASIFTAEAYALVLAPFFIKQDKSKNFKIFTDSSTCQECSWFLFFCLVSKKSSYQVPCSKMP